MMVAASAVPLVFYTILVLKGKGRQCCKSKRKSRGKEK